MDQLKNLTAVLEKHHFWVLCGVVVSVALGLWWVATGSVDGAREARTAEIEAALNQTAGIRNKADHPNQKCIDLTNAETEKLKKKILEAWERLYEEQKEKNPLPKVLGEEFKTIFEDLGPDDDIPGEHLGVYWDFIGRHIETLKERVDCIRPAPVDEENPNPDAPGSARPPTGPGGGYSAQGMGPGGGMEYDGATGEGYGAGGQYGGPRMIGVVNWAPTDQNQLRRHFDWFSRPTTKQVRLAQEDLWVYEALLRIIKETNKGVKIHHDAAVKQILSLQIGRDAAPAFRAAGDAMLSAGVAGGGESGAELEGYAPPKAASEDDGGRGAYEGARGAYDMQPAMPTDGRYVDEAGQPLRAEQEPPFAEFDLMPIRMMLVMDQTKLTKLLVECANSNMPIEVRRVRVGMDPGSMLNMGLPAQTGPVGGVMGYGPGPAGAGYGGGRSGEYDGVMHGQESYGRESYGQESYGRGSYGQGSYGRGPYGQAGASGPSGASQKRTLDVPVEILGTICIYKKPDEDKLGTGAAAEQPPEVSPDTPPAVAPVETPPGGPAPAAGTPAAAPGGGGQPPAAGQ